MGWDKAYKHKKHSVKRRLLGILGGKFVGVLIVILALLFGGYAFYVVGQLREVELQNFRILANAASTVEALIETLSDNVKNLAKKPSYACDFQRRQTRLLLVKPRKCDEIKKYKKKENSQVRVISHRPDLLFCLAMDKEVNEGDSEACDGGPITDKNESNSLIYDSKGEKRPDSESCRNKSKQNGPVDMQWLVRLDKVMADIPFGRTMDVLLIVDQTGTVIEQYPNPVSPPGGNISTADSKDFGSRSMSSHGVRVNNLKIFKSPDSTNNEKSLDLSDIEALDFGSGTLKRNVILAGIGYKMLCQPLVLNKQLFNSQNNEPTDWVFCGLTENWRAIRQALEVAPFLIVVLFSLVLFGLFLWPVAKVLTMSSRERLRFADLYLLFIGSWGALMLATILTVTIDSNGSLKDTAFDSLVHLAEDIEGNLEDELSELYRQLVTFDQNLNKELNSWKGPPDEQKTLVNFSKQDSCILPDGLSNKIGLLKDEFLLSPKNLEPPPPFFSSVFWVEPCSGQQIAKGTVRLDNTPKVRVADRDYYRKVQANKLWRVPSVAQGDRYYLQTYRSMTTGEFVAGLSTKSLLGCPSHTKVRSGQTVDLGCKSTLEGYWETMSGEDQCPPGLDANNESADKEPEDRYKHLRKKYGLCGDIPFVAAVITAQLVSVTNPVLAPGVGFAILDRDGNAIFHSDERRALFENLYSEIGDGERFRAILSTGLGGQFDSYYRAQPHLLHVRPMENLPWSVVTFLERL